MKCEGCRKDKKVKFISKFKGVFCEECAGDDWKDEYEQGEEEDG